MKILVKAKTKAKEEKVELLVLPARTLEGNITGMATYRVSVKEVPIQGRANNAIVEALARHFAVSVSQVVLLTGRTAKQKVFEIIRK